LSLTAAVATIWVVVAAACGKDDGPAAAASRASLPPSRSAGTVQGVVRSRYRVLAGPVVVFAEADEGQMQFMAYVRLNRALPGREASLDIEGVSESAPFRASRRFNCYSQFVADYESPALRNPRDGMKVTVTIGRVRPTRTYISRQVTTRRVTYSQLSNERKERPRLARLGCGANART